MEGDDAAEGEKEKAKKPNKPKVAQDAQEHAPHIISKPNVTLAQFALSAHTLVRPRMSAEKEPNDHPDLTQTDSEMPLSIAMHVTKINLRIADVEDGNILARGFLYTAKTTRFIILFTCKVRIPPLLAQPIWFKNRRNYSFI